MSRKTRKLKAKIDILRSDINYHKSNVRLLLNKPTELQIEELKFQYGDFNYNLVAGRQPDQNKTSDGLYDYLAVKKVELHKFPKEEMESREYHVSKHSPVNMLDNKNHISLPEHWYIRVTHDNVCLLNDYLKTHKHRYEQYFDTWNVDDQWIDGDNCAFFHSDSKDAAHTIPTPMDEYTEVTTEMVKNYMKTWHNINSLVDKSWLEVKKEAERRAMEEYSKHVKDITEEKILSTPKDFYSDEMYDRRDANSGGCGAIYGKDLTKEQIEKYDDFFKSHVGHAIEAGTHKAPDEYVLVKVKVGSVIMDPGYKATVVGSSGIKDHVGVGDLKKRADAMEKCTDQECKPIEELPKTLESLDKIYSFIGLREKSAITNGNKDIIFMKTNNYLNSGRVGYFNTQKPNLMYSPFEMLSDWKSNYVKPLD